MSHAITYSKDIGRENIEWFAMQGNRQAQRDYAEILRAEGKDDWADYYEAKANGTNPHFWLESFLEERQAA
ncbi:hypothetical protein [Orrella sp. 11846]|uniref:hypothetical protein n=1 Tax=Orrella sp. 11846 TaxID=3409913 RepID=UPI003B59557A